MRINAAQRDRLIRTGIYFLILVAFGMYTWVMLEDARETRLGRALERNQNTAQLSARFLDSKWTDLLATTRLLANEETLALAVRNQDHQTAQKWLGSATHSLPDVDSMTLFLSNGAPLASGPSPSVIRNARDSTWYPQMDTRRSAYIGWERSGAATGNPTMYIVVRLGGQKQSGDSPVPPEGFLYASVRAEAFMGWLEEVARSVTSPDGSVISLNGDSAYYLVSARHEELENTQEQPKYAIIATSKGARPNLITDALVPIRAALSGQSGGYALPGSGVRKQALIGYASAEIPHWGIIFTRSEESLLDPAYSLASRFGFLLVPMFLIVTGAVALLSNMYARQERLTRQLAAQNIQLEQANQIRSDFLANVSHDLRTPLTSMSIAISGLLDTEAAWDPKEARGSIEFISEEIDLLEARVRNLLEMSRLDAGVQSTRKIPADLPDMVGAAIERLGPMLGARDLALQFPDEPLLVNCDPTQIETVLLNLLENAIKYSPPDSPLCLAAERKHGNIRFAIEDNGPGIPLGQEGRIFEKFYRAANGGQAKGTGLGLAICKTIIEAHGGTIGVANRPDGGARFWFTLPAI